jgi:predicted ATPase
MADVGFGYSQLLPIVIQLWTMLNNKNKINNYQYYTLLIEQPELHLHPALQARLIKAFISVINAYKKQELNIRFILETHSESMINTLGHCVSENSISTDDVAIYIFEKRSTISIALKAAFQPLFPALVPALSTACSIEMVDLFSKL